LEIIIGEIEESGIYVEVSDPEVNLAEQIEKEVQLIKKDYLNLLQITAKCKPTNELEEGCIYSDHRENCLVVDTEKKDNEILDLFKIGFQNAVLKGPMKGFPIRNITMVVEKMEELSPDSLRYEIVIPLVRNILHEAIMNANPGIYEPIYSFSINTPIHYLGPVLTVVQRFGSSIGDTEHLVSRTIITGEISVESSLQIATELRSASEGYAFWQFEFQGYKRKK
jgi:translation elongation factor EF-G